MNNPITLEGLNAVKAKFEEFKKERAELVVKKEEAYQQGDPSDNPEYESTLMELTKVEETMTKLEQVILTSNVIDSSSFDLETVKFGLVAVLENEETGDKREFKIVGTDEVDATNGKISNLSPLGKSLLNKSIDDEVFIGEEVWFITEIKH